MSARAHTAATGADSTKHENAERVRALEGLALPRASHYGEIVQLAFFAHAVVSVAKTSSFISLKLLQTQP